MEARIKARKSICFLIPSLEGGGMERVMSEIVNFAIHDNELKIYLILYGKKSPHFYTINDKVTIIQNMKYSSNKIFYFFSLLKFLRQNVSKIKPDVVLSFGEIWNNIVLLSLLGKRVKIIVSDRSSPNKNLGASHEFLRKLLYPLAYGVISQTELALKLLKSKVKIKNSFVLPNPIREFGCTDKVMSDSEKENIILNIGRFSNVKNQEFLIKLFIKINNKAWKLYIVGNDHASENLKIKFENIIKVNGFQNNIFLFESTSDIFNFYNSSKIFAFPSLSEGFPNVVLESLFLGVPVIGFKETLEASDLIQNGINGVLIEGFNEDEFEKSLTNLMNDDIKRVGMADSCKKSVIQYERNNVLNRYLDVIKG